MGVPLQDELPRQGRTAFADRHREGRTTDRVSKRAGERAARGGGGGRNDQAEGCGRRLCPGCLAKQKDRSSRKLRAPMQAPRGGEVEADGIAVDFQENRRQFPQPGGFFGNPQRVSEFRRLRDDDFVRCKPGESPQPGRMGEACFGKCLAHPDPEDQEPLFPIGFTVSRKARQREGKSRNGAGIAHFAAVDLGQGSGRHPTAQHIVQARHARVEKARGSRFSPGAAAWMQYRHSRSDELLGQRSLDLRYFPAQGKNSRLRHDV
ncbi:hypothetical protein GCM10007937_18660 [Mesorhizobium albiziae]|nr:hypothetical protein GCM10007937_18660 [Mesorhizobium albiziae]